MVLCVCRPVNQQGGQDILYYAVNSMNLIAADATDHSRSDCLPVTAGSRVTYDQNEGQEALERSFQPFTHLLYSNNRDDNKEINGKRQAESTEHQHMNKRFHQDPATTGAEHQNYETTENYIIT